MNELFRKIPCSERLPENGVEVDTDDGELIYYDKLGWYRGDRPNTYRPYWWLESIQLPAYEEIEKSISELQKSFHFGFDIDSWKSGFKSALELLTKGCIK